MWADNRKIAKTWCKQNPIFQVKLIIPRQNNHRRKKRGKGMKRRKITHITNNFTTVISEYNIQKQLLMY